jgi:ribosomal protein L32
MSVRMRHTSSHTKNRRSHHALKNRSIVKDKESGALRLPHRLDETTGMYRGKLIVTPKVKKTKAQLAVAEAPKAEKEERPAKKTKTEKPVKVNKRGK